jgi:mono/diheme cytochrome c family protein
MKRVWTIASFVGLLGFGVAGSMSVAQHRFAQPPPPDRNEIERGRYLVEEVAKCPECHTPRKPDGQLNDQAWLQGAPIWIEPVGKIKPWADHAPALAGGASYTEAQVETVLEQGTGPNGEALRAPMHVYHMNHEDARAVYGYLQSLPAPTH